MPQPPNNPNRHPKTITLTTGAIFQNPNTNFIVVTLRNVTNQPQTATVSMLSSVLCNQIELGKYAYACGSSSSTASAGDPATCDPIADPTCCNPLTAEFCPPTTPTGTPLTVTVPPQTTVTVYSEVLPVWHPPNPWFEVRVTLPFHPPSPIFPPSPCLVNIFGIDLNGIPQEGNTIFHHLLIITPPTPI